MTYTDCESWNLKIAGKLAREGFGNCAHLPKWQFVARGCDRLKPAAAEIVAARVAWMNKRSKQ